MPVLHLCIVISASLMFSLSATSNQHQSGATTTASRNTVPAGGISLLWGRQMTGGDDRPWPSLGGGGQGLTPKADDGTDVFSAPPGFGLVPISGPGSVPAQGLMLPPNPLFPGGNIGTRLPLGLLGTAGLGGPGLGAGLGSAGGLFPSHVLPDIAPLAEAELLTVESARPWEREDLMTLNELPSEFQFAASEATNVTLGPFKELAVMYVNSRLPMEARLHKTVANRVLLASADQVGLKGLVFRLHLQNAERLATPESMVLFIRMRATQKQRSEQKKVERSERINLHSNSNSGSIEYFEGIDLVIGRERDSIIRPMLNRYFRTHRGQCRAALDSVGLRLQDLRSWTGVELCKALFTLSQHVDESIWHTAVNLHQQKIVRRRSHTRF